MVPLLVFFPPPSKSQTNHRRMQREIDHQLTVWEGEWPSLKNAVSITRRNAIKFSSFVVDIFDAKGYVSLAKQTAVRSDQLVVDSSRHISRTVQQNPWILPASGFATFATFVFSKSLRWGVFSATRNSVIATSGALCLVYPHELRRLAIEHLPF